MRFVSVLLFLLLLLVQSCGSIKRNNDSLVELSVYNDIKYSGTYYIIETNVIEEPLYKVLEEIIDDKLSSHGFTKLVNSSSKITANYLIFLNMSSGENNNQSFSLLVLDNTSNKLKKVFSSDVYFKKNGMQGNLVLLSCAINATFEEEISSTNLTEIKTGKRVVDCSKEYKQEDQNLTKEENIEEFQLVDEQELEDININIEDTIQDEFPPMTKEEINQMNSYTVREEVRY